MIPAVETVIKTKLYGEWLLMVFADDENCFSSTHRVLIKNRESLNDIVCVRVHSDCYTGDVLNSSHCDCGDQLAMALKMIHRIGSGLIIFPANHEGRGIGLINKLKAYNLIKELECDTYTANHLLGFPDDLRQYEVVHKILDYLNISKIELLTNDTTKISNLQPYIVKITPLITEYHHHNIHYIKCKNEKYGHVKMESTEIYSIALISTLWHRDLMALPKLNIINNLNVTVYEVPGSFELPFMAKHVITKTKCDAVICLGLILKGDTAHFEYISNATINGLMTVQLETGVPIINGVLNCYTLEQAIARFDSKFSDELIQSVQSVLENIKK